MAGGVGTSMQDKDSIMTKNRKAKRAARALKAEHGISFPEAMQQARRSAASAQTAAPGTPLPPNVRAVITAEQHPRRPGLAIVAQPVDTDLNGHPVYAISIHPPLADDDGYDYEHDLTDGQAPSWAQSVAVWLDEMQLAAEMGFAADDLDYALDAYADAAYQKYLPRYLDEITTAEDFTADFGTDVRFFAPDTDLGLVGYGHIDKQVFATAVNTALDLATETGDRLHSSDDVVHTFARSVVDLHGSWTIEHAPDTPHAIPVTIMSI